MNMQAQASTFFQTTCMTTLKLPGFYIQNLASPDQDRVRTLAQIKNVTVSERLRKVVKAQTEILLAPWIRQKVEENQLF